LWDDVVKGGEISRDDSELARAEPVEV